MATLRCPRCSTLVSAAPGGTASCPSCGFTAQVPPLPPRPAMPLSAPPSAPSLPAPASPSASSPPPEPLTLPSADWPAADWTPAKPARSQPAPTATAASTSPLSPLPTAAAAPSWGQRGKTVEPVTVALLAVVTLGIYSLFFWWRVSREADLLKGRRHAHGLARAGILMGVLGGLVAAFLAVVVLIQATTLLGDGEPTDEEVLDAILEAAVPLLALIIVAALVAVAGSILLYVAMYRSWSSIRDAEVATGRPDPVNPALYLFLPLGLNLLGSILDRASPALGLVLSLASVVFLVMYMAKTQGHLNRLWSLGVAGPAPAPAAR